MLRLHAMLREEGWSVGETLVKEYVREWKRQRREVAVPLVYQPGDLAEVDFFEVLVDVAGVRKKAWMFVMRWMHSGRDLAWLYERQDPVSFLDGHVRALAYFGAVPRRILYDNLKPAVAKVLVGSEPQLTSRFQALVTHYVFEPCFARPGTGSDKGGVAARGKGILLQELVPIPVSNSLSERSEQLLGRLERRAQTTRNAEGQTIAERFEAERGRMLPLPCTDFHAGGAGAFRGAASARSSDLVVDITYIRRTKLDRGWAALRPRAAVPTAAGGHPISEVRARFARRIPRRTSRRGADPPRSSRERLLRSRCPRRSPATGAPTIGARFRA